MSAFCLSEFFFAFWKALSAATFRECIHGDQPVHVVKVRPLSVTELIVEWSDDVREAIELGARPCLPHHRHRLDLGVRVGKLNVDRRLLLGALAVHVDRLENAF